MLQDGQAATLGVERLLHIDARAGCARVAGELCFATTPRFTREVSAAVLTGRAGVLDLSGLAFIDLTGMRAVSAVVVSAEAAGRPLTVIAGRCAERLAQVLPGVDAAWARKPVRNAGPVV